MHEANSTDKTQKRPRRKRGNRPVVVIVNAQPQVPAPAPPPTPTPWWQAVLARVGSVVLGL